ncbi:26499_t:CDS:2, partial [Gigaspora margarita]
EVEEPRPFLSMEKNLIRARELLIWIQRSILDRFPFLLKDKDGNTNVAPLNLFLSHHRITSFILRKIGADHASRVHGVEHYGVMNDRQIIPVPKQENNEVEDIIALYKQIDNDPKYRDFKDQLAYFRTLYIKNRSATIIQQAVIKWLYRDDGPFIKDAQDRYYDTMSLWGF